MTDRSHAVLRCPICGEPTEQFTEGYCTACHSERQNALDEHNARFDWWESMTDRERGQQIRKAVEAQP